LTAPIALETPKAGTANALTGMPAKSRKLKNLGDQVGIIKIVELK
jgi:hypothetical protein